MPQNALVNVGASVREGNEARQSEQINALNIEAGREDLRRSRKQFSAQERTANSKFIADGSLFVLNNPGSLEGFIKEGQARGAFAPDLDVNAILNDPDAADKLAALHQKAMGALGGSGKQFGEPFAGSEGGLLQRDQSTGEVTQVQARPTLSGFGDSSATRTFEALTEGLTDEDRILATRIELGLDPRAVGSSSQTIAADDDLTESVAESQATIEQRKEFGKKTGASRSKTIDSGFETINKINVNIRNIDKAIQALNDGASTGAIESRFFPTFRESTVRLEQIQKELGLDVIGSVTFGALSKGELNLALVTALPTSLQPTELLKFLEGRKVAQQKLADYYAEQIDFLDQGGSIAGFMRNKKRQSGVASFVFDPESGQLVPK